jgi:asparagine synthase (glutamine-hydrolysing)
MNDNSIDILFGENGQVVIIDGARHFVHLRSTRPDVEVFLAGCIWGEEYPVIDAETDFSALFGRFVALVHEPARGRITITNDRFAMLRLFVARREGRIYCALSLGELARRGIVHRLDLDALASLFAFNVPFGIHSLYAGAETIAGATRLRVDLESLETRVERIWDPSRILMDCREPLVAAQSRLTELLLEGFAQATHKRNCVAVTLSGGVDSRLLLAAGLHLERQMEAYSTGVPGSRGLVYAQRMAGLCGVQYHSHPLGPRFVQQFAPLLADNVGVTDGMSFSSEVEAHWLRDHVPETDTIVVHGAFGELYKIGHMHQFAWTAAARSSGRKAVTSRLLTRGLDRLERRASALKPALREELLSQLSGSFEEKMAVYSPTMTLPAFLQNLYLDEFLGKVSVASGIIWNAHVATVFPFSYPRFIDLLLRVQPEDRADFSFPRYFLNYTHRGLAGFPDSNTGTPIGSSAARIHLVHIQEWLRKRLFGGRLLYGHTDVAHWIGGQAPAVAARICDLLPPELLDSNGLALLQRQLLIPEWRDEAADALLFTWMLGLWFSAQQRPPVA